MPALQVIPVEYSPGPWEAFKGKKMQAYFFHEELFHVPFKRLFLCVLCDLCEMNIS
jgi:hypothetical protein